MADEGEEDRRLSPDSSTQLVHREKHKHHKRKKHKHKSKKRKRRHSDEHEDDESNDEKAYESGNESQDSICSADREWLNSLGEDLVLDIQPLTAFIDDRNMLNNKLFTILGRKEIKKLLPKSIKKMPMEELRSRCLDQLEVISKKRLLKIMEGREMSCSSTESEEISQSVTVATQGDLMTKTEVPVQEEQTDPPSVAPAQDEPVNILEELSLVPDQQEIDELIEGATNNELPAETTDEHAVADAEPSAADTAEAEPSAADTAEAEPIAAGTADAEPSAADTECQLLELEYRARALKSMVKAQQNFSAT